MLAGCCWSFASGWLAAFRNLETGAVKKNKQTKTSGREENDSLISGGSVVGGGGGQPLLAGVGTRGVTGEKGTMSNTSVDCGLMETLPACARGQWKYLRP